MVEQIDAASTSTTLAVSPPPPPPAEGTLTASVTSSAGVPGGTVTFADGGSSLGTAPLSGGTAELVTCFAHHGAQTLTAAYAGSTDFTASMPPRSRSRSAEAGVRVHLDDSTRSPPHGRGDRWPRPAPTSGLRQRLDAFVARSATPAPALLELITVAATPGPWTRARA